MIKKNINFSDFCDEWSKWEDRKDTFSYKGKRALFDYLEQYSEDTGEDIELDIVALCCEYTEYEDMEALKAEYSDIKDMEDLENHTQVIKLENSDSFIIQQF